MYSIILLLCMFHLLHNVISVVLAVSSLSDLSITMNLSSVCIYRTSSNIWHTRLPRYLSNLQIVSIYLWYIYHTLWGFGSDSHLFVAQLCWSSCFLPQFGGVDGVPNEGAKAPSASKDLWWWDVVGEHVCIYTNIIYFICAHIHTNIYIYWYIHICIYANTYVHLHIYN